MIKSNEKEVWNRIDAKLQGLANASNPSSPLFGRIYRTALLSGLALIQRRVFTEGKNSQNVPFGVYSKGYYDKVRTANNRSSTRINLELTGEMRQAFKVVTSDSEFGLGFEQIQGEGSYSYNINTKEGRKSVTENAPNAPKRAEELAGRYGEFLLFTDDELEKTGKIITKKVNEWLS